jgi:hypothetical protein
MGNSESNIQSTEEKVVVQQNDLLRSTVGAQEIQVNVTESESILMIMLPKNTSIWKSLDADKAENSHENEPLTPQSGFWFSGKAAAAERAKNLSSGQNSDFFRVVEYHLTTNIYLLVMTDLTTLEWMRRRLHLADADAFVDAIDESFIQRNGEVHRLAASGFDEELGMGINTDGDSSAAVCASSSTAELPGMEIYGWYSADTLNENGREFSEEIMICSSAAPHVIKVGPPPASVTLQYTHAERKGASKKKKRRKAPY